MKSIQSIVSMQISQTIEKVVTLSFSVVAFYNTKRKNVYCNRYHHKK